jgi:hypothetical protein
MKFNSKTYNNNIEKEGPKTESLVEVRLGFVQPAYFFKRKSIRE